jgi:hypothetical protein
MKGTEIIKLYIYYDNLTNKEFLVSFPYIPTHPKVNFTKRSLFLAWAFLKVNFTEIRMKRRISLGIRACVLLKF